LHLTCLACGAQKGPDDGLNDLLAGLTQPAEADDDDSEGGSDEDASDGDDDDASGGSEEEEEDGDDEAAAPAPSGRYVPPAARGVALVAPADDAADERLVRRVRGLLNRLGEANAAAVTAEAAGLLREGHTRRAVGSAAVSEVVSALVRGPRASGQYACALAAFVAGLCATGLGPELGARALAATAAALDAARAGEGDSRSVANLGALVARLYLAGLVPPALLWGMLCHVTASLGEADVALTLAVLRAAGPRLRADDPAGLRDFIISLQERSAAAQQAGIAAGEGEGGLSQRARLLLELVCDLKNGKRGAKLGAAGGGGGDDFPAPLARWLREADVGVPALALSSLTWRKLLDVQSHRGAWWLPAPGGINTDGGGGDFGDGDGDARGALHGSAAAAAAAHASAESSALLARAASLRMNTDARRAVFCALMSAEDCADAAERLLKLPLAGGQEREIPRVLLECCLQEAAYNPFYELTAVRLGTGSKRHRTTLQFAVWDRWKELGDADARRLSHLARFCAGALARGALPLGALRGAELAEAAAPGAPARRVAHFRLLLTHLLVPPAGGARTLRDVHALLLRAAGRPALAGLRAGLLLFMKAHLLAPAANGDAPTPQMRAAVRCAEAALNGESMAEDAPR
jgi:nucleolar MIF4G domain-containing protein 1